MSKEITTVKNIERKEEVNDMKKSMLLWCTEGHRALVFNGRAYEMKTDGSVFECLEYVGEEVWNRGFNCLPEMDDISVLEEILQFYSQKNEPYDYQAGNAVPFSTTLKNTIRHQKETTELSLVKAYHADGRHPFAHIIADNNGNSYPLWYICAGFEDSLYEAVVNSCVKDGSENERENAFFYFMNADGYPLWAYLCDSVDEMIEAQRLFFDLQYDDFVKEYLEFSRKKG